MHLALDPQKLTTIDQEREFPRIRKKLAWSHREDSPPRFWVRSLCNTGEKR